MNSTVPVTMSGFWYSSPIVFQYAVLANSRSYGSRSFSSLMLWAGRQRLGACDRRWPVARIAGRRRLRPRLLCSCAMSMQRHDVGVDHAQRRLRAQLAAQQPHRFLIGVHVLGAAGHEAGDRARAGTPRHPASAGSAFRSGSRSSRSAGTARGRTRAHQPRGRLRPFGLAGSRAVIDFLEQLVVLTDLRIVRARVRSLSRTPCAPCRAGPRARRRSPRLL